MEDNSHTVSSASTPFEFRRDATAALLQGRRYWAIGVFAALVAALLATAAVLIVDVDIDTGVFMFVMLVVFVVSVIANVPNGVMALFRPDAEIHGSLLDELDVATADIPRVRAALRAEAEAGRPILGWMYWQAMFEIERVNEASRRESRFS